MADFEIHREENVQRHFLKILRCKLKEGWIFYLHPTKFWSVEHILFFYDKHCAFSEGMDFKMLARKFKNAIFSSKFHIQFLTTSLTFKDDALWKGKCFRKQEGKIWDWYKRVVLTIFPSWRAKDGKKGVKVPREEISWDLFVIIKPFPCHSFLCPT